MDDISRLEETIAALESQRSVLGDAVMETALGPLRQKLAALYKAQMAEQRKVVTVLFSDLAGFTAMAERMDPEDLREAINQYFTIWQAQIEHHGGVVEKFIGDAVMAVFGAVTARENDPENAVRAALALRDELESFNQPFFERWGVRLSMRVGVHTGPVVVSTLGERAGQELVVVGDTVNLANRLQANAPVNSVLISHDTYRHVRGSFDVQSVDPLNVKGKSQPVQAYLVMNAKERTFREGNRGVEGIEVAMVGRASELERLQTAMREVIDGHGARWLTIVGEAGLGKSRLLYELDDWLELLPERIAYFKGRAVPSTENTPYALLRDLLSFRFQIRENDPPEKVREQVVGGLERFLPELNELAGVEVSPTELAERAVWIGQLLGFDLDCAGVTGAACDARQLRDRAAIHLGEYFQAVARRQPMIWLLEDLHWADDSSIDLLASLAGELSMDGLLVVGAARPELYARRPDGLPLEHISNETLHLQPLSAEDTNTLVAAILERAGEAPPALLELVGKTADGNPFYVEEFLKMLIEDGVIEKGEEHWQIHMSRLEGLAVPQTLTEVLQARLDSLDAGMRGVLQRASVVGRVFWEDAVDYLNKPSLSPTGEALDELGQREMIFPRKPSAFQGTDEFQFKHALLRDVTYESLLRTHRRMLHSLTARWLEDTVRAASSERQDEHAGLIAEHYEHAGDQQRARQWYQRSVEHASARFANKEALRLIARALALTEAADGDARFELLLQRESVHAVTGDRVGQEADLAELNEVSAGLGPAQQAEVSLRRASYLHVLGEYGPAIAVARRAGDLANQAGRPDLTARSRLSSGGSFWYLSQYDQAEVDLQAGLEIARQNNLLDQEGQALRMLGVIYDSRGQFDQARRYMEDALAIQRRLGSKRGESMCLNSLGVVLLHLNDVPGAMQYYQLALQSKREIGDLTGQSITHNNLGIIAHQTGDFAAARQHFQECLNLARQTRSKEGVASALNDLGNLLAYLRDFRGAQIMLDDSYAEYESLGDLEGRAWVMNSQAWLQLAQGNRRQALQTARDALALAEEIQAALVTATCALNYAQVLCALDLQAEAAAAYQRAAIDFEEMQNHDQALLAHAAEAYSRWFSGEQEEALALAGRALAARQALPNGRFRTITAGLDTLYQFDWDLYQLFSAAGDERAAELLTSAAADLNARAAAIIDPELQRAFTSIPIHQQLLAAARQKSGQQVA